MMISGGNDERNDEVQPQLGGCRKQGEMKRHSSSWAASTESRIVRVSRVLGGKDRHSKVRTVKGLRDRRVRLSVPTAIQLYDLQDRLGLSQPSKVVDWLIDAAQHEIDKLPPLHFPTQDHHHLVAHHLQAAPASMSMSMSMLPRAPSSFDGDKAAIKAAGLMAGLNNNSDVGLGGNPLAHSLFFAGESNWNNNNNNNNNGSTTATVHDPQTSTTVAHHHSPFSSLLSLAPGPQLVFYSPEGGGFAMKEAADHQFPVDSIDHSHGGQLSLSSSARSFLHSGSSHG